MIPSVQCMHTHTHTHTHSLTTKNFLTLSRLASKLFFKPCLSTCCKNSPELLSHSPHFVYETFSKDLNGILNTHSHCCKKTHKPKPRHTQTQPRRILSLSLCSWSCWVFLKQNLFPTLFLFGFVNRRTKLPNRPIPEHDDVLRRTQTLTCGCLCGGVRNLCLCLCSVRPVNQTCPPHNSRSSVPPHTVLFF